MTKSFIEAMEEILDVAPGTLSATTDFKSLPEWDSLAALSTLALIEDMFGKIIDPSEFRKCKTIGELTSGFGAS